MRKLSPTTINVKHEKEEDTPGYSKHCPEFIKPDTKLIVNWLGRYYRAIETKDFIYFVNFQEGDENACILMYRKSDWSLASGNYFAYNDMFELTTEKSEEITYLSKSMRYNLRLHKEATQNQIIEFLDKNFKVVSVLNKPRIVAKDDKSQYEIDLIHGGIAWVIKKYWELGYKDAAKCVRKWEKTL